MFESTEKMFKSMGNASIECRPGKSGVQPIQERPGNRIKSSNYNQCSILWNVTSCIKFIAWYGPSSIINIYVIYWLTKAGELFYPSQKFALNLNAISWEKSQKKKKHFVGLVPFHEDELQQHG